MMSDAEGGEHAVLSDGWHHIRLDVEAGTLSAGPVILRYGLEGSMSARPKLLPLRRLVDFSLHRRFARALYPVDPRVARWLMTLQVLDGLAARASQREIGEALYGAERVSDGLGRAFGFATVARAALGDRGASAGTGRLSPVDSAGARACVNSCG